MTDRSVINPKLSITRVLGSYYENPHADDNSLYFVTILYFVINNFMDFKNSVT